MNLMEQNCSSCGSQNFVETPCMTKVCTECGKETRQIKFVVSYSRAYRYEILAPYYHRRTRFKNLLDAVLFPRGVNSIYFISICSFLRKEAPFKNTVALMKRIKASKLRNKYYSDLHFFHKFFVQGYMQPNPKCANKLLGIREKMLAFFKKIEWGYTRFFSDTNFFSYGFLLNFFLEMFNLNEFLQFLKPIRCKVRREKHELMLQKILNHFNAARFNVFSVKHALQNRNTVFHRTSDIRES